MYNDYMSFRAWLSVVTFVLIAIILYLSRDELVHAWELLGQVNLWILMLLIPVQILSYFAVGEMIFEYLRDKGSADKISRREAAEMALELNFVNHVLPSGGVSGVSYMGWRLGQYGIPASRSTMAQVVRFATGFAAYIVLLVIAVIIVTIDGNVNRWMILVSSALVGMMTLVVLGSMYLLSSKARLERFSVWFVKKGNKFIEKVTFGKYSQVLKKDVIEHFFAGLHTDYVELRKEKKVLVKPFLWGIVFTISDVALFYITFLALGETVNPAPILIAYGLAAMAGFFVLTPGGAGAYEALMVGFLALAGLSQGVAIAGVLLTRVILLVGTIMFGYIFYQRAILKYGKGKSPRL